MKRFNSSKLFYRKYPYKLSWYSPLSHFFRGGDLTTIRDMLDHLHFQYEREGKIILKTWNKELRISTKELHEAQKVFSEISKHRPKIRIEGRSVQLYSEHRDWLYHLANQINASEWWEPNSLLQPDTIVMGESMRGWGYRVTLGSRIPNDFITWALNNLDKIKIGPTFKNALGGARAHTYLYGMYFYVKNEKMLNLVTLVLGSSIARIDKIIVEDKKA